VQPPPLVRTAWCHSLDLATSYHQLPPGMDSTVASASRPSKQLLAANAIGYVLLIIVNVATQTGLFGDDNGTISARFPTMLTPAGWAFSIWGIIFLLQGFGVVYQLLPYGYDDPWKARIINTIGAASVRQADCEHPWRAAPAAVQCSLLSRRLAALHPRQHLLLHSARSCLARPQLPAK